MTGNHEIGTSHLYFYNQTEEIIKLDGNFKSFRAITSDGYPIYKDTNHITPYATKSIFKDFMKNGKLNKSTDYEETITDKFNDKSINDK